ncbi:MAG: oxygen-independent coproporphyrinogen III oxidase [Bacteroidota bacterium]
MESKRDIIEKYNQAGPRYTSYPPANYFSPGLTKEKYIRGIEESNTKGTKNISLYFHVPFCPRLCHFCGCNTHLGNSRDMISTYMNNMLKEFRLVVSKLDKSRPLTQVHWGGGTPNAINLDYIKMIMDEVLAKFTLADYAEIAIECNPAYLTEKNVEKLAHIGFNRISLGIQDFQEDVLEAVNRAPSKLPYETLIHTIRQAGFEGINLDFIYGLPKQTNESFRETIQRAIDLQPDRIVTFSYAHVPWVKKEQKVMESLGLPTPDQKLDMFMLANEMLDKAGYVTIGMDHYAKPEDELAVALKNKQLHRNFQGYCSRQTTGQVYAFGSSSISQLDNMYAQNTKDIVEYSNRIEAHGLATEKGYALNQEERIIRHAINEIMCNSQLGLGSLAKEYNMSVDALKTLLDYKPEKFNAFEQDNLLVIEDDMIYVTEPGRLVIRNIAMAFDPKLQVKENTYSKTV